MKSRSLLALQLFLWAVCAFHVVIGLGLNVSPAFPQVMAGHYGAEVNFTPALLFMAGAAAKSPLGNRAIVYGLVLLFAARGLQRIVFQEEIANAVSIAASRNIANAAFFLLMALALAALLRMAYQQAAS